jgi:hypothetical protein
MAQNESHLNMTVPNIVFFPERNYHDMKAYQGDLSLEKILEFMEK